MDYEVSGRSTGRGAFTDANILFPGEAKVKSPDHEERSRTGNHWEKTWYNLPEGTMLLYIDITNSGKEYRSVEFLHNGEFKVRAWWKKGKWQEDTLGMAADLWRNFGP